MDKLYNNFPYKESKIKIYNTFLYCFIIWTYYLYNLFIDLSLARCFIAYGYYTDLRQSLLVEGYRGTGI